MESEQQKVTAVVCCYNEEDRVGAVLDVLSNHDLIEEVIVVDDGSIDASAEVIKKYLSQRRGVKLLQNSENKGKGAALKLAMKHVKTRITFMCDADLVGLNSRHVYSLILPVIKDNNLMTLAVLDKYWHMKSSFIKKNFTILLINGTRVLKSDHVRNACKNELFSGWGVETVINQVVDERGVKIKKVDLKNVKDVIKTKKKHYKIAHQIDEIKEVVEVNLKILPKYAKSKASNTHNKIFSNFFQ